MNALPKTYGEALRAGYIESSLRWERGYVSRQSLLDTLPIKVAGGKRKGQIYVSLPVYTSSRFCYRQYLTKVEK